MITNCRQCGNYTILLGQEAEGSRTAIKKLRLDIKSEKDRGAVLAQVKALKQLHFEIEMLLAAMDVDVWAVPAEPKPVVRRLSAVK